MYKATTPNIFSLVPLKNIVDYFGCDHLPNEYLSGITRYLENDTWDVRRHWT